METETQKQFELEIQQSKKIFNEILNLDIVTNSIEKQYKKNTLKLKDLQNLFKKTGDIINEQLKTIYVLSEIIKNR